MASTSTATALRSAHAVDTAHPSRIYANAIRALAMDAVEKAKCGHPGMPMGMADVATVLFQKYLKFDVTNPTWADRDRFILSGGHGSMLIYALGYLCGYEKMTLDEIKNFRQLHALTAGHPEKNFEVGIETTTGPLGQGIANAVGFALAERIMNARFGNDLVDHYTYCMAGDGDLMEGISHEACSLAGHLKLNKLICLYDDNGISIDGPTTLSYTEDPTKRFEAYGWTVITIDAHDFDQIDAAIAKAQKSDKPVMIRCQSTIGYGAPTKANTAAAHGAALGAEEIAGTRSALSWSHEPFVIPQDVLDEWRKAGVRGQAARKDWEGRYKASAKKADFDTAISGKYSDRSLEPVNKLVKSLVENPVKIATRQASGNVLDVLLDAVPELIGGSADLTGSVNTYKKGTAAIQAGSYGGRYIHYGVREHGTAAIMNGMSLHGGILPYSGTFLQFADYCRPAIRVGALMKTPVIHVMTHDSIGLGEDGPTHQPVEHLAALRVIPNLIVMRPCDAVETAECWQIALDNTTGPSLLSLTRQALVQQRTKPEQTNLCAQGGYILRKNFENGAPDLVLIGTGSEVEIAAAAFGQLKDSGKKIQVISMPCIELFEKQDEAYKASVLGPKSAKRIIIEAAVRQSWDKYLEDGDTFIGMKSFGESAPSPDLYKHFGITAEAIVAAAK
ncbi:MAG TPA: transketolase [Alphaproteobacteria bacterium]